MKFRTELWRIAKFLMINFAVNVPLMFIWNALYQLLLTQGGLSVGLAASVYSYSQLFVSSILLTLLHRYFTFRATEPWIITVPVMLIAAFGWQFVSSASLSVTSALLHTEPTTADFAMLVNVRSLLWPVLSYLLQRCIIYRHTADTNGWYARMHLTNDEEGV